MPIFQLLGRQATTIIAMGSLESEEAEVVGYEI